MPDAALLKVSGLTVDFATRSGAIRAVDGVDLSIDEADTLGVVGESGSGKSVTALSLMKLVRSPGRIVSGRIDYCGTDLVSLADEPMRRIRGREIAMIFQEPMTSLNPVFRVGDQIAETLRLHEGLDKSAAWSRALSMLDAVKIPSASRIASGYPHQLSGGMRQRVMIAMALACRPKLLIADEPTTALDVTIQAQIIDLLREIRGQMGMALMLITHDMGVIAESVSRVAVMYGARVVEQAQVGTLFSNPLHPYTAGLLRSIPKLGSSAAGRVRLEQIPGTVPTLRMPLSPGCRFAARCPHAQAQCSTETPVLREITTHHSVACHRV